MPKTIGTNSNPITDASPMGIAMSILEDQFKTGNGANGLYEHSNDFWQWEGQWNVKTARDIEDIVLRWMSAAWFSKKTQTGTTMQALRYDSSSVKLVVRCIESAVRLPMARTPGWIGEKAGTSPLFCVGFKDVVVDVAESVKQEKVVTSPRKENWFDCMTLPCNYNPTAECPTWKKCIADWSGGDPLWETVLKREFGMSLISFREYAKWFMHYGMGRSGKGTIEFVRKCLIGDYGYMGIRMSALGKNFGLHKLTRARVLTIGEVFELEKHLREEATGLLKNLVGMDPIDLDRKFRDPIENIVSPAMVVMLGNELPNLPNKGRGLSMKMVPLNFDHSFEGKEDVHLKEKLVEEMEGIARWAIEGAIELVGEKESGKRFPMTEGAKEMMEKYHIMNNPSDTFLHWAFTKNKDAFVASELVWGRYLEFCDMYRMKAMARNQFNQWLEAQNSWGVRRHRQAGGGKNGFKGIGFKVSVGFSEEKEGE